MTKGHLTIIAAVLLIVVTLGVTSISLMRGLPLEMILLGLMGCSVLGYLAIRTPEIFLVGAAFAPQWKTYWPLIYIDRIVDLTLVMLAFLLVCLAWRLIRRAIRLDQLGLQHLFFGQSVPILCFMFFAACVTSSYFYTSAPEYGGVKLLRFLTIGSLLLVAPLFLISTEQNWRRFAVFFVACSALTAVQLIVGLQVQTHTDNTDITRIGAGWLIGMAITIALFYPLFRSQSVQSVFLLFSLPLLSAGLIASAARGPIVALGVVVIIRMIVWLKEGKLRTVSILAGVLAVSGVGSFLVLRNADRSRYTAKANELLQLMEGDSTRGSATARLDFYRAAITAIPDHLLLGRGVGSWSVFYYGQDERNYPHNLFLEVTFEEGLLGLGALLLFFAAAGVSILRLLKQTDSHFLVLAVLVLYCVLISMFSGDLDDNRLLWLWAGMALAVCRNVSLAQLMNFKWIRTARSSAAQGRLRTSPSWLRAYHRGGLRVND
jgi:O-antigen ligase